jgi:phosphatidylglycerophosphate synthase
MIKKIKLNLDLKKILHTNSGKKDEEDSMFLDRFFSLSLRRLADFGIIFLKNSKITPNQITITRAIVFLPLIFYFFSKGTYIDNLFGILCCLLNTLFDILDGNLARKKLLTSEIGSWLDHNLDKIMTYLALIGITLGSYRFTHNSVFLVLGIFVLFFHGMMANIANDYETKFGEDIFFNASIKKAVYYNKKSTFFDKVFVDIFIFNSFWTYFLFTLRYQFLIGAIFNIMPYMIFYWIFAFTFRWIFLCSVYLSLFKKESNNIFINELKKRAKS